MTRRLSQDPCGMRKWALTMCLLSLGCSPLGCARRHTPATSVREIVLPSMRDVFARDVALSHDGSRLIFVLSPTNTDQPTESAGLWLRELAKRGPARQLTAGHHDLDPAWSANEKWVVFRRFRVRGVREWPGAGGYPLPRIESDIWMLNVESGKAAPVSSGDQWNYSNLSAAPEGQRAVASCALRDFPWVEPEEDSGGLILFRLSDGPARRWPGDGTVQVGLGEYAWSADGRYVGFVALAHAKRDPPLAAVRLDVETLSATVIETPTRWSGSRVRHRPALSHQGTRLTFLIKGQDSEAHGNDTPPLMQMETDFGTGRTRQVWSRTLAGKWPGDSVVNPAYPQQVAVVSLTDRPESGSVLQVLDSTGERFRAEPGAAPAWSADGKVLAYVISKSKIGIARFGD